MHAKSAPVLFLTANRLGDAILTTGALSAVLEAFPESPITLVCGRLPAPIFAGLPPRVKVLPLQKRGYGRHWFDIWRQCVTTHWGAVIDLRNTPISRLLWRDQLVCHAGSPSPSLHRAAYFSQLLGLSQPRPLQLWLDTQARNMAAQYIPDDVPVIALGPTANWVGKMWPLARFAELAQMIDMRGDLGAVRFAVIAAADEAPQARQLLAVLPPERRIDLIGVGDAGVALACVQRCAAYIGNDSGLMHGAAALGVPTLGLFGPTNEKAYGPYGVNAYAVRGKKPYAAYADINPKRVKASLMDDLSVDTAYDALIRLIQHCHRRQAA